MTATQTAADTIAAALGEQDLEWERLERPYTDRCQTRSQDYADTRGMANGNQFQGDVNETTLYDPTDPHRHDLVA